MSIFFLREGGVRFRECSECCFIREVFVLDFGVRDGVDVGFVFVLGIKMLDFVVFLDKIVFKMYS